MRIRLSCLTLFILIGVSIGVSNARPKIHMIPGSGIRLDIQPVYDVPALNGFFPLRITLANNSGRARTWVFRATQKSYQSDSSSSVFTQQLTVPDQSEQTFEVYVWT